MKQHKDYDIAEIIRSRPHLFILGAGATKATEMVDKWSIKPSLAEKLVDILEYLADKDQITTAEIVNQFGINPTTTKRYLRQLTEFCYLEANGGNKNRTYKKLW